MGKESGIPHEDRGQGEGNPRAVLRVPEVLIAVASAPEGALLANLVTELNLPKTSLHRILRTLEAGGYVLREGQIYKPGPESIRLARLLTAAAPQAAFPGCARDELERLAQQSGETVMLSELSDSGNESVYLDVIESHSMLRFSMKPGHRRPLYSVASGKVMLAFQPQEVRQRYCQQADFIAFTPETATRETLPDELRLATAAGVIFDRNGMIEGASGIASPVFDRQGKVFAAISVAGPTERIESRQSELAVLVRQAGERISRLLGLTAAYPPPL